MKKVFLLTCAITVVSIQLNAQIPGTKLKNKIENAGKKSTSAPESTPESAPTSTKKSEPIIENAPISDEQKALEREIIDFRDAASIPSTYLGEIEALKKINGTVERFHALEKKYAAYAVKDSRTNEKIVSQNNMYATRSTEIPAEMKESIDLILKRANTPSYNMNPLALDGVPQEKWKVYPNYVLEDLAKVHTTMIDSKMYLCNPNSGLEELIAQCEAEQKRLETYMAGDYPAFKQKYDAGKTDAVRLDPSMRDDAALTNFVKAKFDANSGKVIKAVIVDANWSIDKTSAGIPEYKYISYNASVKDAAGNCKKHWGRIVMKYEGGGTYGEQYLTYRDSMNMNCENATK